MNVNHEVKHIADIWVRQQLIQEQKVFSAKLLPSNTIEQILFSNWQRAFSDTAICLIINSVTEVLSRRASLISKPDKGSTLAGRTVSWDLSLVDGSGLATETGVVDKFDAPAWDMWIGYDRDSTTCRVYSWVPDILVESMDHAIRLSITHALSWLPE